MTLTGDDPVGTGYKGTMLGQAGHQFFGRMAANISHDLKNRLATINEKTGLLADLALMAEKGSRPLDLARVKSISGDIAKQVQRADTLCLRLNRFAHSADFPRRKEDLSELLTLMAALIERQAAVKSVVLEVGQTDELLIEVNPFLLEHVIFLCLNWVIERKTAPTITITARPHAGGAVIALKGTGFGNLLQDPPELLSVALAELGATLEPGLVPDEIGVIISEATAP